MPQAGSCQGRTHWSAAGVEVKLADSIDAPLGLSSPCSGVMVSLDPPGAPQGRRHAGRTRERRLGVVLICTRKPQESVFLFPGSGLGTLCPPPPPGYRRNPDLKDPATPMGFQALTFLLLGGSGSLRRPGARPLPAEFCSRISAPKPPGGNPRPEPSPG